MARSLWDLTCFRATSVKLGWWGGVSKEVVALSSEERQGRNHRGACLLVLFSSFSYNHLGSLQIQAGYLGGVCFFSISFCECHQRSDPHGRRCVINILLSSLNASLPETPWEAPSMPLFRSVPSKSCVTMAFLDKFEPDKKIAMFVNSWIIYRPSSGSVGTYKVHVFTENF